MLAKILQYWFGWDSTHSFTRGLTGSATPAYMKQNMLWLIENSKSNIILNTDQSLFRESLKISNDKNDIFVLKIKSVRTTFITLIIVP